MWSGDCGDMRPPRHLRLRRLPVVVLQQSAQSRFAADLGQRDFLRGHLTPTEYRLLTILFKSAGKIVTHRQLLREVWGPAHRRRRTNCNQLRRKLGDTAADDERM